jgi:phage tail sheath gpL-like
VSSPSINTTVPEDFVPPQTFHVFNFLRAGNALRSVPLTVALICTKSNAGTAVVGQVYDVNDSATMDLLAGANSEGSMMCRQAMFCTRLFQRGPKIVATFLAEPGAGVANVQTITPTGTATSDGTQVIKIAGRTFNVFVASGTAAAANATAIFNTIKTKAETLPVVVTLVGNAVTLTHPHKGVNGKDVLVSLDQQVAGITLAAATTTVGTGAVDITPALLTLSPTRYDGIVTANHTTTDVTAFLADATERWAAQSKTWGFYFMFELGTIGTATTLGAAANTERILVGSWEGCTSAPGEGATTMAVLAFSRARPNSSYDDAVVPLYPPAKGLWYTAAERNTAIKAGLTPFVGVVDSSGAVTDGRGKCVQLVTTRTTIGGFPDDRLRDLAVPRTGVEIATQLDAAVGELRENNPDGISQSTAVKQYRRLAAAIIRAEASAKPPVLNPDFVEADVQAIIMEGDLNVINRVNGRVPYHPDIPNHQAAWYHDVIVGQ